MTTLNPELKMLPEEHEDKEKGGLSEQFIENRFDKTKQLLNLSFEPLSGAQTVATIAAIRIIITIILIIIWMTLVIVPVVISVL